MDKPGLSDQQAPAFDQPILPNLLTGDGAVSAPSESIPSFRKPPVNGRRPKQTDRRSKKATVRLSEAEFAEIKEAAETAGLSVGAYLAECATAATTGAMHPAERGQRLELVTSVLKARTQMARIGVNLNQIALVLNSSSGTVHDAQMTVVLDRVEQALVNADAAVSDMQRRSR